jgi:ferredoxin
MDCAARFDLVEGICMADKNSKHPLNAPGAWYVDTTCTMCRTCLEEAPNLLKTTDDETAVYFVKQPENDEETAASQRAMEVCPTLAIGNDG